MSSELPSGSDSRNPLRGCMAREKSFPSTQSAVLLVYISLEKRRWFSLKFS